MPKSNTKYTSQHIDNQSFDEALQVKVTELINTGGTLVNPATEEKQDPTAPYAISDLDESGTTKYYGFLKDDGGWYIMSVTGTAVRYVKGASGYSFASPSSLTYDTFSNTF